MLLPTSDGLPMTNLDLIHVLDAELPQTQCGLCGHAAGCLPYARALVQDGEAANKCVPGGQPVADTLARLLNRPPLPVDASEWPIASDGRPQRILAVIREDDCIGCTKCINACPVDAIIGSGKLMHTILTDVCTGCELCLPPCPVDCIDLIDLDVVPTAAQQQHSQDQLRQRYSAHQQREQQRDHTHRRGPIIAAALHPSPDHSTPVQPTQQPLHAPDPERMVKLATLRSQIGKLERQLLVQPQHPERQATLAALQQQLQHWAAQP
jgi:electron transport complex protein RnfB